MDTSNPFAAKAIPSLDESFVVIHFRNLKYRFPTAHGDAAGLVYFAYEYHGGTGRKMGLAMELIMAPLVERLMEGRKISE